MKALLAVAALFIFVVSLTAQMDPSRPTFAEYAMDGTKIETEKLRGKIIVLNLWFINCPNCVEEIKMLNNLVDEYKDNKDVVFLAPAASKKADLEKFLVKNPFKYQVIPDSTILILSKFGTPDKNGDINVPFPMHYVLDREGTVVLKEQGTKGIAKVKSELKKQFAANAVGGR